MIAFLIGLALGALVGWHWWRELQEARERVDELEYLLELASNGLSDKWDNIADAEERLRAAL